LACSVIKPDGKNGGNRNVRSRNVMSGEKQEKTGAKIYDILKKYISGENFTK